MRQLIYFIFFLSLDAFSYVPTVESLFRHGGNPDVTSSSVVLNFKVTKVAGGSEESDETGYFKIVISKYREILKITQAQFENDSFLDNSIIDQSYLSSFSPFSLKGETGQIEKGIFWGLLESIYFNEGKNLLNFLQTLGVQVKLNDEILNKEKVNYLVEYKKYLVTSKKNGKSNEGNPLRPNDPQERLKVEKIMSESMYSDFQQVQLLKNGEDLFWGVEANNFQAIVSYSKRHPMKLSYKATNQEVEFSMLDYYPADGIHYSPREITIKNLSGVTYKINVLKVRYFSEKEDEVAKRVQKWESFSKGKKSNYSKPSFLI
jgi:hypothetical protein